MYGSQTGSHHQLTCTTQPSSNRVLHLPVPRVQSVISRLRTSTKLPIEFVLRIPSETVLLSLIML